MEVSKAHGSARPGMRVASHQHHHHRNHPHGRLDSSERGAHQAESPTSADFASLRYRRTEKVGLFIQTQEGDSVRLRFKTKETLKLDAAQVQTGDETTNAIELRSRNNSKISISIKGDLNADELAAIQQAFEQATALAGEFFAGGVEAAFEGAAALNFDAEQLARVHLRARSSERLTYSARGFGSEPTIPDTPEPPPEIEAPAEMDIDGSGADEQVDPGVGGTEIEEALAPSESEESSEGMESEEPQALDPRQIIGDFLSRLTQALTGDSDSQTTGALDFSLKIRVFRSTLLTLSETRAPEEPGIPELVPDTLDALAEQEQPPLNEVA
jgi:hypothetical protein